MTQQEPRKKTPGVLLPNESPLRTIEVVEGLYVVEDNPYTDRYDFFEASGLYQTGGVPESGGLPQTKKVPEVEI